MQDLAVEKRLVPVTIYYQDGHPISGEIFLGMVARNHLGAETVLDFMNTSDEFFVLKVVGVPPIMMMNKRQIVEVVVDVNVEFSNLDLSDPGAKDEPMIVAFNCDFKVEGNAYIDMPPQHSRAIDFLNQPEQFLLVRNGDRAHVINRQHINYVIPGR